MQLIQFRSSAGVHSFAARSLPRPCNMIAAGRMCSHVLAASTSLSAGAPSFGGSGKIYHVGLAQLSRRSTYRASCRIHSLPAVRAAQIAQKEEGQFRPPQMQETHPGKEHEMEPKPSYIRPAYKPAGKLEGKIALVTGGDSGIGRSVGVHFALEGATVAFTYVAGLEDKDAEDTIKLLKDSKTSGAQDPLKIPTDLGFDENCKKVIDAVVEKYGKIDILVNNAAEQHTVENVEDLSPEQLERTFRTNIFSQFFLVRHGLPHMKEGSTIINTTSVNAFKGNAKLLDYTATKGSILAFTRGLALQVINRGIRVNAVAPGPVWTPLIPASFKPEQSASFGQQTPMGRAGEPDDIAPSYVFLASDDSSLFTGQCLHPNGGYVVNA
jgi:NAD(P)-dependent dehydrogenase (short-subunit alcohol dehydrogenase family)